MTRITAHAAYAAAAHDSAKRIELHGWTLLVGSIDLAAFQAMSQDERRATWAAATDSDKLGLAMQILRSKGRQLDSDVILGWLEALEETFGAAPIVASVAAALERLADENVQSARAARRAHEMGDARFFQRAANAYLRALEQWQAGVRPELPSGAWLLPSRTDGVPHLLTKDGDWVCSCKAGTSMHWASALIIGIEVASEDADRFDAAAPGDELAAPTSYTVITVEQLGSPARLDERALGQRIAAARRALMATVEA